MIQRRFRGTEVVPTCRASLLKYLSAIVHRNRKYPSQHADLTAPGNITATNFFVPADRIGCCFTAFLRTAWELLKMESF